MHYSNKSSYEEFDYYNDSIDVKEETASFVKERGSDFKEKTKLVREAGKKLIRHEINRQKEIGKGIYESSKEISREAVVKGIEAGTTVTVTTVTAVKTAADTVTLNPMLIADVTVVAGEKLKKTVSAKKEIKNVVKKVKIKEFATKKTSLQSFGKLSMNVAVAYVLNVGKYIGKQILGFLQLLWITCTVTFLVSAAILVPVLFCMFCSNRKCKYVYTIKSG